MLGLGLGIGTFGTRGGVADAADGQRGAALLLGEEPQGLAIDFRDMTMVIKDTTTPANNYNGNPNGDLVYSAPSTKWIRGASGLYVSGTTLRAEYDGSGVPLGVRCEPAATNLVLRSTDIASADWSKVEVSTTDNAATSVIGGTTTADRVLASSATAQHRIDQAITTVAASTYTVAAIVESSGGGNAWLRGPGSSVTFDLQLGAINATSAGSGTIAAIGGGRYFLTATGTAASTSEFVRLNVTNAANSTGNWSGAGEGLVVHYVGCELGAVATSPIVTEGSTVTRVLDVISLATSAYPGGGDGNTTVVVEFVPLAFQATTQAYLFRGNANGRYSSANNVGSVRAFDGTNTAVAGTATAGVRYRQATVVDATNGQLRTCINGGAVTTAAYDGTFGSAGNLTIGNGAGFSGHCHIGSVLVLPVAKTSAQMQTLSTL